MAALSDSVPQLVNMISAGSAPSRSATCRRALVIFRLICPPKVCMLEGLP